MQGFLKNKLKLPVQTLLNKTELSVPPVAHDLNHGIRMEQLNNPIIIKPSIITLLLLVFCTVTTFAQIETPKPKEAEGTVDEWIENLVEDTEDAEVDNNTLLEDLQDYAARPMHINKCSYEDLEALGILTPIQINGILDYRENMGDFIAIYELQAVPALDLETIRQITPFVKAGDLDKLNVPFGELMTKGQHQIFARYTQILEEQKGFIPSDTLEDGTPVSKYLGDPSRLYFRYRYNYGTQVSYGITAEKDPGEEFFTGSQKQGFDFYSAHLYMKNMGHFKHIALGDYEVKFGQGLVVSNGLGSRKSSYVMSIAKQGAPLKQYTSVNEYNFFRGAATTVGFGNLEATVLTSYKRVDGNVLAQDTTFVNDEIAELDVTDISSVQIAGFHRTNSEIEDKNAIKQLNVGGDISYKTRRFSIGASALYTKFDAALTPTVAPYNKYRFSGDKLLNASVHYDLKFRNFNFFGETAISDNGGISTINGFLSTIHPKIAISAFHRHYGKKYQSLFANAIAEGTRPQNEQGFFIGTILKPFKGWKVNAYFDVYKHPWLKFGVDAPSHGTDYLLQVSYKPGRYTELYVRFRDETKQKNAIENTTNTDFLSHHRTTRLRFHLQHGISKTVTLKSRAELSWFSNGTDSGERGYMLMQDVNFKALSFPLSFNARFAIFNTSSYNTRIYAFENDVLYSFSIPAYFNKGTRYYLGMRYKIRRGLDIWLRFSQTYHANQETLGSGNDEIDGNVRSEVKAMLRVKF